MSLTGLPLLVSSVVAALAALVLTIRYWRRGGRARGVTRTLSVLLCEVLALFAGGVIVNHALDDLFPSWSAFFNQDRSDAPPPVLADPGTRLDVWLASKALEGKRDGLVFDWEPSGTAAWHLPAPPTVYVPPRYFTQKSARFPVILVVAPSKDGPAQAAWDPHKANLVVPRADAETTPAVVVFLRVDHPNATLLAETLPQRLDEDLRTSPRGWGVIGIAIDAAVALDVLVRQPVRFWSGAALADGTNWLPKAVSAPRTYLDWQAALTIAASGKPTGPARSEPPKSGPPRSDPPKSGPPPGPPPLGRPTPGPPATSERPKGAPPTGGPPKSGVPLLDGPADLGVGPAGGRVQVEVIAAAPARLPAALRWMYGRLPAALAAPFTGPSGTAPIPSPRGTGP